MSRFQLFASLPDTIVFIASGTCRRFANATPTFHAHISRHLKPLSKTVVSILHSLLTRPVTSGLIPLLAPNPCHSPRPKPLPLLVFQLKRTSLQGGIFFSVTVEGGSMSKKPRIITHLFMAFLCALWDYSRKLTVQKYLKLLWWSILR